MARPVSIRKLKKQRVYVSAQKLPRLTDREDPIVPLAGMNLPETKIARALSELKIRYSAQTSFYGGSVLGGARADFVLPDYRKVILYNGPYHNTTEGAARDTLTNLSYKQAGFDMVLIVERDLKRLKPRLLELIGRPL